MGAKRENRAAWRAILRQLAALPAENSDSAADIAPSTLAEWLIERELGPLARARLQTQLPPLAQRLQIDGYSATAQSSVHLQNLGRIQEALAADNVPLVLLKGAALAQTVYANPVWRIMSDVDLWVQRGDVPRTTAILSALGYQQAGANDKRPFALQLQSNGEIQFSQPDTVWGLVELHWSPLSGWWLQRTAAIDETAVWSRKQPLPDGQAYQLAAEDTIIQSAIHISINHQFDILTVRHLLDISLTAQQRAVNWQLVTERARAWRVETAVYLTLSLLHQLIGGDGGVDNALTRLQPSRLRRWLLRGYVTADSIIAGREIRNGRSRYLLLLLLIDRRRGMIKLIYRTLWPESDWLQARYSDDVNHWQHLWRIVRYGQI